MFTWTPGAQPSIPLEEADILGRAVIRNEPVYIPYRPRSALLPSALAADDTRARLVLPIRHGDRVLGLIDLRSHRAVSHSRLDLVGLQVLADQLGLAMRDAELYGQAIEARAMAERSDRTKTQLLANVSHELRTPLNVILGLAQRAVEMLVPYDTDIPHMLMNDLQQIHRASRHLLHVTNDLLDLSRAEIHELELALKVIDPRPVLADAFHAVADASASDAVDWHLELPERLPMIRADAERLHQILLNLLGNAKQFTDRGQITLSAEVIPPHLHIWVQDTGIGISSEDQERIFEPFVTAEHLERRSKGTGLGLSIVRQLVALHHGSIALESQPGEGSAFHVYLPLPSLSGEAGLVSSAVKRILLLISANERPPAEVFQFCQHQELEILHLQSADDLDDVPADVQPAAVAWDLACTRPAHWALFERMRNHPPLQRAPFMLYGPTQGANGDLSMGPTSFVIKPVDARTLLEMVEMLGPTANAGPILVVEDDADQRSYLAKLVARGCPGFRVCTAGGGLAALACMAQETPSLVVLDLRMPDMDGFQVLESMRAGEETSRVPVLIMTGHPLSLDDVKRLDRHALVTVHSKGVLSDEELAAALHRSLFGTDRLPPHTGALVKRAVAYLQQSYAQPLSRRELAQEIGVSESYLSEIFRKELGLSPWQYLTRYRIRQAKRLLRCTTESVTNIALRVGFEDPSYFSRAFRRECGVSPTAFRTG
jgi:signal transduction histidine kinase/AraC-like DNA-binding protein